MQFKAVMKTAIVETFYERDALSAGVKWKINPHNEFNYDALP